jgi:hypothetical protein
MLGQAIVPLLDRYNPLFLSVVGFVHLRSSQVSCKLEAYDEPLGLDEFTL